MGGAEGGALGGAGGGDPDDDDDAPDVTGAALRQRVVALRGEKGIVMSKFVELLTEFELSSG